ncbi:MAG: D-alanyl-D-alanine carboxypeptidase family protein [Clostridia bacterium]|jgi:D-alanyl-D-alanine carboxypeptidase|nr:D-alanyl-D-alanine carboxypeptidase family protein [Clostridia bacterium]
MARTKKKSKAVPIVAVLTLLIIAAAVVCFLINPLVIQPQRDAIRKANEAARAEVEARNKEAETKYASAIAELESQASVPTNPSWPEHKNEGWDILDLTGIPLENQSAVTMTRAELMNKGMLLVNEWHSRPEDFDETGVVSVSKYYSGDQKIQAKDNNVTLFPDAIIALREALDGAKADGLEHYMVEEGYRTYEQQDTYFQNKVTKLSSKYTGDALIAAAKKEVNYPGTSEYNSGLGFELRQYEKNNPDFNALKYSGTDQGKWMNENCWKYGIVFRFPQAGWPLESSTDKSFKTGVSKHLNLYRYVGKGNAAVMHYLDFTLEEYIEYLEEHPHIALFEDGVLKYEIYRQYIGDAGYVDVQLTRNAKGYTSSLDNMGAVITVFEY